ncbi:MAG: hypothetical protein R3F20_14330 [Planctomycetota bacterium]
MMDAAARLASWSAEGGEGEAVRIDRLHRRVLGRAATSAEIARGRRYLAEVARETAAASDPAGRAWRSYAQVLIASNEFLYLD